MSIPTFWLILAGFSLAIGMLLCLLATLFKVKDYDNVTAAGLGVFFAGVITFWGELPDWITFALIMGVCAVSAFLGSWIISLFVKRDPQKEKTRPRPPKPS